ncbi:MAG: HAD hydrolase-like protein [Oscillospiraceae bacterium]|jgi:FMN phosphatase YigB (HAD superfamily)|nr:HAD hydrolase-like protein [Oscillospiraceae bacterium]
MKRPVILGGAARRLAPAAQKGICIVFTTVLFDLDGTLLPMDQDIFLKDYFSRLCAWCAPRGYEPKALIDALWASTRAMIKNDGSRKNREVFWESFVRIFGDKVLDDEAYFDEFYATEFRHVQKSCGFAPEAGEIIAFLKGRGVRLALATNPIFPAAATRARAQWANLRLSDFACVTTYENACHSKPNPAYYADILAQLGCPARDCLMVGNDAHEDTAAAALGIGVFLLTDNLINRDNRDTSRYPQGNFSDLFAYLRENVK